MGSDNNRNKGSTVVVVKKKRFDINKFKAQKSQTENSAGKTGNDKSDSSHDSAKLQPSFQKQAISHNIKANKKIRNLDFENKEAKIEEAKKDIENSKNDIDTGKSELNAKSLNQVPAKEKELEQKRKKLKKNDFKDSRNNHAIKDNNSIPDLNDFFGKKKVEEPVVKKKISGIKLVDDGAKKSLGNDEKQSISKAKLIEERRVNARYVDGDENEKVRSLSSLKRQREKVKRSYNADAQAKTAEKKIKDITIPETITVQELANRMAVRSTDLVKELMKMGMMITATKPIDADTAELLATELGYTVRRVSESDVENVLARADYLNKDAMSSRDPVISVMGHVDHGKTSLLDALRSTNVVSGESGGITQHIGASRVKIDNNKYLTFLDTPGHEAFTAMRMRGAKATDMVILVVAADDGIKEQTIEAINHAKAAEIPIIVAINKIDKEGAKPQQVLNELLAHEIVTESLGGEVLHVEVSAKNRINLDKLIEAIQLQSELIDLKANYDCLATGVAIETRIDKNKGVVASFLVQHGKLKVGDIVLAGLAYGKVKSLTDDQSRRLDLAGPSVAVEVLGLNEVPDSGEPFYVMEAEKQAREIVEYRINRQKDLDAAQKSKKTLEDIFNDLGDGDKKEIFLLIKADVRGSVEAIKNSVEKLSTDKIKVSVVHGGAGGINESDITLAKASEASILAFNVRAGSNVSTKDLEQVDVRYYSVIYDLVDDVKAAIKGMLDPTKKEKIVGKAEIRKVFDLSKFGKIAGSYVLDGNIKRSNPIRIVRDSIVIHDGKIKALKRFKDDVKEVGNGMEFGISFESFTDFKENDVVESYEVTIVD